MPPFLKSEESLLPSYASSQEPSTQAGSAPSEPPPAYVLHDSTRPPGFLNSLLPHRIRSRRHGHASPLSDLLHGPSTQADTPPSGPASDKKQPVVLQARPPCVQVCPHEVLSFERLQRILSLPGFQGSYKDLDALTAGPDHIYSDSQRNRRCKPRPNQFGDLETYSDYSFSISSCLTLTTWWILHIREDQSQYSSRSKLQEFLRDLHINLCPHKSFDDPWIVEILYRKVHPQEKLADPLDQWEADASFKLKTSNSKTQCDLCSTKFEELGSAIFRLSVTRNLGKGKSPSDPVWLAQCDVAVGEERAT